MSIHPQAIVSSKAKIGKNVTIYPLAYIEDDVIIGDDCIIYNNACLMNGTRIGNNVNIHHGAVIAGLPQDLKFKNEVTTVEIGDRTVIREFVTLNRGTEYHHKTVIGADCFLMAYVHCAHDVIVGDKVILANCVQIAGHVEIGYHASIGGLTPVHQFVKIGAHSFIGGGLRVPKDVPPFILGMGEPLVYGGLNKIGLQRRGFSSETIETIKNAYRVYYSPDYLRSEAIQKIKDHIEPIPEVLELIKFLEASSRGVINIGR
jgi:UDP-N-acetylglucosamine acyltransferase